MVEGSCGGARGGAVRAEVDFFSLGTNDLVQYTMAAERGNASVAALADGLNPSVLRLIRIVVEAAGGHGKWVGVCGELASDPEAVPVLVASASPSLARVPRRSQPSSRLSATSTPKRRANSQSAPWSSPRRRRYARCRSRGGADRGLVAEPRVVIARAAPRRERSFRHSLSGAFWPCPR